MLPRQPHRTSITSTTGRTRITLEGYLWLGAAIALGVTGWTKGINLILLLSYLLVALWLLNWWVARRTLRGLTARRAVRTPLFARQPATWFVDVVNEDSQTIAGWQLIDEGPAHRLIWFVTGLAPGQPMRLRRDVQFPRRGAVDCRQLIAMSSLPFGLVRREVVFDAAEKIMVYPAVGAINLQRLRRWLMQASRPDERNRRARRRSIQEVEFHSLRSFRPGDSPRWIHWRTSARRGELMVREFDQQSQCDLLLILDAYQPASGKERSHLEAAISLAATIVWQWGQEGGEHVVLAAAGHQPFVVSSRDGRGAVAAVMTALAEIRGSAAPDVAGLDRQLRDSFVPGGSAVFVSSRDDGGIRANELSLRLGRPIAYLSAMNLPTFYQPPDGGAATVTHSAASADRRPLEIAIPSAV